MSASMASLETLAAKHQNIFSIVIMGVIVWIAASAWRGLTTDVSFMKEKEVPQIHQEFKEIHGRLDHIESDVKILQSDVKELKEDMKEVKKDITDMKSDMAEMKAMMNLILKKLP